MTLIPLTITMTLNTMKLVSALLIMIAVFSHPAAAGRLLLDVSNVLGSEMAACSSILQGMQ